MVNHIRVFYIY